MRKIGLETYIALNNRKEAIALIKHYGLPKPRNYKDLIRKLRYIAVRHGEDGLTDLVNIHPDKGLFVQEGKSECGGGSSGVHGTSCCSACASNAAGDPEKQLATQQGGEDKGKGENEVEPEKQQLSTQQGDEDKGKGGNGKKGEKEGSFVSDHLPWIAVAGVVVGAVVIFTRK